MIHFITGDLLSSDAQALVNTVNTVGVMGKGIALQFKERFPLNFKRYKDACKTGELQPGKLLVVRETSINGEKIIINFPTKTDWKQRSSYAYIEAGLQELVRVIEQETIQSIAIPPLGCGNGGLKWEKVRPMMEQYLGNLPVEVFIFEPNEAIKQVLQKQETPKTVQLSPARAMLLYALFSYESMGEHASLFVANKLAYFLQRLGENLRLNFKPHHYGPYANEVGHVLYKLNGVYMMGMEQNEIKAFESLQLRYDKLDEVRDYVNNNLQPEQRQRLKNLLTLIAGFQSALSLEVLASVDFIQAQEGITSVEEVFARLQNWSDRKKRLIKERHVAIAVEQLNAYKQHPAFA
ncbi:type II toxin-antitoxin system antitoxin DNA ADP-ribosyl glycohydrolase DarG [Spirosoma panaciterrae]|uniref:type II toxin-antitoxin system antitoxin DNA ADP-ribosyl glycohydrolase DarG n=1 Tax=Spirosoma panaciterrae TaxID=496058 RepID=UPI000381B9EB|nr:macro domain-containing protein [Spirosoma panaciterrae]